MGSRMSELVFPLEGQPQSYLPNGGPNPSSLHVMQGQRPADRVNTGRLFVGGLITLYLSVAPQRPKKKKKRSDHDR